MPDSLRINITKGRDGPSVLSCTRPDGSSTWSRVGDYFPTHDMAHFVVETELRIPHAFYSLVLDGWGIDDFTVKGAARSLPPQANLVEALVGRLQRDLMPGSDFTAESFNEETEAVLEGIGNPERRPITDEELSRMRRRLRELLSGWAALAPGESLELEFRRISPAGDVIHR
ncbi:MAG TPA: hypothetical protein VHM24_02890 [Gemmatimonadaceae bacterium]|nr:hypothetical protein [Gemmatimonadaceae bacterium]